MLRFSSSFSLLAAPLLLVVGCAAPTRADGIGSQDQLAVEDSRSLVQEPDGSFDVTCKDGRVERGVTADQIRSNAVCTAVSDPFDPASCTGTPSSDAVAAAGIGSRDYHLSVRWRDCTNNQCGAWVVGEGSVASLDPSIPGLSSNDLTGTVSVAQPQGRWELDLRSRAVCQNGTGFTFGATCQRIEDGTAPDGTLVCGGGYSVPTTSFSKCNIVETSFVGGGNVGAGCIRISGHEVQHPGPWSAQVPDTREYETALLMRF